MLKIKSQNIPRKLQSVFWSVDIDKLDRNENKSYIITQVLNYGDEKDIKWLFLNYHKEQIKNVLIHPARGIWRRNKLRKWLAYFNFIIDPLEFETAVRDLNLRSTLMEEFWKRKGTATHDISPRNTL